MLSLAGRGTGVHGAPARVARHGGGGPGEGCPREVDVFVEPEQPEVFLSGTPATGAAAHREAAVREFDHAEADLHPRPRRERQAGACGASSEDGVGRGREAHQVSGLFEVPVMLGVQRARLPDAPIEPRASTRDHGSTQHQPDGHRRDWRRWIVVRRGPWVDYEGSGRSWTSAPSPRARLMSRTRACSSSASGPGPRTCACRPRAMQRSRR